MFKVFGLETMRMTLAQQVLAAVNQVVAIEEDMVEQRSSSGGNYFCISINATLRNEEQRRRVYTLLQELEGVRYIL
jgi:putative lipoic acid-binding regulatory protein